MLRMNVLRKGVHLTVEPLGFDVDARDSTENACLASTRASHLLNSEVCGTLRVRVHPVNKECTPNH